MIFLTLLIGLQCSAVKDQSRWVWLQASGRWNIRLIYISLVCFFKGGMKCGKASIAKPIFRTLKTIYKFSRSSMVAKRKALGECSGFIMSGYFIMSGLFQEQLAGWLMSSPEKNRGLCWKKIQLPMPKGVNNFWTKQLLPDSESSKFNHFFVSWYFLFLEFITYRSMRNFCSKRTIFWFLHNNLIVRISTFLKNLIERIVFQPLSGVTSEGKADSCGGNAEHFYCVFNNIEAHGKTYWRDHDDFFIQATKSVAASFDVFNRSCYTLLKRST